jgi:hypothetical protein
VLHCLELPVFAFDLTDPRDKTKEDNLRDDRNRDIFLRLVSSMPHIEKEADISNVSITKPQEMFSANKMELADRFLNPLGMMMSEMQGQLEGYIVGLQPLLKIEQQQEVQCSQLISKLGDNSLLKKILALRSKPEVQAGQLMLVKSQAYTKNSPQPLEFKLELTQPSSYSHYEISYDQKKVQVKDIIQAESDLSGVIESSSESNIVISLWASKKTDYKLVEKELKEQLHLEEMFLKKYNEIFSSLSVYMTGWREIAAERLKEKLELYKVTPEKMKNPQSWYEGAMKMIDEFSKKAETLIREYHHQRWQLLQPKATLEAVKTFLDQHMAAEAAKVAMKAAAKAVKDVEDFKYVCSIGIVKMIAADVAKAAEDAKTAAEEAAAFAAKANTPEGTKAAKTEAAKAAKAAEAARASVVEITEVLNKLTVEGAKKADERSAAAAQAPAVPAAAEPVYSQVKFR